MTVRREDDATRARHAPAHGLEEADDLVRRRVADRVGEVHGRRTRLDDRLDDRDEEVEVAARRVLGRELHVAHVAARAADSARRLIEALGGPSTPGIGFAIGTDRTLLACERVALNFLQRLSGVATAASLFAAAVQGTRCQILDTRKTTPGLRTLEKAAAAAGGVINHRMGLYDAVLIKNNHIAAAGGVRNALERARHSGLPIEIEVRTREELHKALECGATHLLLDNLTPDEAADWIREIAGRAKVELSGGITLANVRDYADVGADFVSSGAITHSARAMDISFRLELA